MIRHADFPLRQARTRSFTLGLPRSLTVSPDGARVLFLRTDAGDDPVHCLWCLEVASGQERRLVDPRDLVGDDEDLPDEERRRRERAREQAGGIVTYTTDRAVTMVVFGLSGRVFVTDVVGGGTEELEVVGRAFGPRIDPTGSRVGYVTDGDLYATDLTGPGGRIVGEEDPDVQWGVAEFVAAEEMSRLRGFWWSPDGSRIAAARVDESPVDDWYISDPAHPDRQPTKVAYPAAGRPNAAVTLSLFDVEPGDDERRRVDVTWDLDAFPYLGRVVWQDGHPLTLEVVTRRQDRIAVLTVDEASGVTETVAERHDEAWVELVDGAPRWLDDGRLVTVEDVAGDDDPDGTRRVVVDGTAITPAGLQVSQLVEVADGQVWFTASAHAQQQHAYRVQVATGELTPVTQGEGWHGLTVVGEVAVVSTATPDRPHARHVVSAGARTTRLASHAAAPGLAIDVRFLELTDRRLPSALLLPSEGDGPWPVLLSPYGGPHAAPRSQRSSLIHLEKRWFAEQGFAVLVVDGRGTPGRSRAWERAVRLDLATPVLTDQVDALHAAAAADGRLDLSRVAIRGWSFGGFLSALAVLRRPDVFHAAVVGAPVTDWRLYDTYYTERYLGLPDEHPEAYRVSSLVDGEGRLLGAVVPPGGRHPAMLLVHGLADDNVVAAHTLRLSGALLADGRPHEVLPLTGVTHMTPHEVVAQNLLYLEV
ncbi:MAG TPA: DPP IV N-terminal domain-containing protein, partial [Nitriliruptorales bacterium]